MSNLRVGSVRYAQNLTPRVEGQQTPPAPPGGDVFITTPQPQYATGLSATATPTQLPFNRATLDSLVQRWQQNGNQVDASMLEELKGYAASFASDWGAQAWLTANGYPSWWDAKTCADLVDAQQLVTTGIGLNMMNTGANQVLADLAQQQQRLGPTATPTPVALDPAYSSQLIRDFMALGALEQAMRNCVVQPLAPLSVDPGGLPLPLESVGG